jgi:hypothetical protein
LYEVELSPAKGLPTGKLNAKGTPNQDLNKVPLKADSFPSPPRPRPKEDTQPIEKPSADGFEKPKTKAEKEQAKADKKDDALDDLKEKVRKAMLDPNYAPSPVKGAGSAAPLGTPDGNKGGQGTEGKAKLNAQYRGMLAGWFRSRVNLVGLDIPKEERKKLSVLVTISISPGDLHVTGCNVGGSTGNAGFDSRVNAARSSAVGATLPAPPDGADVPSSITFRYHL